MGRKSALEQLKRAKMGEKVKYEVSYEPALMTAMTRATLGMSLLLKMLIFIMGGPYFYFPEPYCEISVQYLFPALSFIVY